MANPAQASVRGTEPAIERARAAQERLLAIRASEEAECELRNAAIVEAYEAGAGTRQIARDLGIGPTTVNDIIAAR